LPWSVENLVSRDFRRAGARISVSIIGLSVLIKQSQLGSTGLRFRLHGFVRCPGAMKIQGIAIPFAANTEFLADGRCGLVDRRFGSFQYFPCLRRISIFDIGLA